MPNGDRENITLNIGSKAFMLDAPSGLSDEEVIRRAIRSDTEFAALAKTHPKLAGWAAEEQAHQQTKGIVKSEFEKSTKMFPESLLTPEQREKYSVYETMSGKFAAETAGAFAGGAAVKVKPLLSKIGGSGLVRGAAKVLTRGAGIGAGTGVGTLAGGGTPKEAAQTGAGATVGSVVLEPIIAAASNLIRPFLQKAAAPASEAALSAGVSKRAFQLAQMSDAEEGIRKSVVAAPRAIRQNVLNKLYPTITEPVDIYASAKAAIKESGKQIAHGAPSELHKTMRIGRQIGQIESVIRDLTMQDRSLATDAMQQTELLDTLQALKDKRTITFSQARNLRSALGQAIAKGQGYKIPAETFQTLRSVYGLIDDGIKEAATQAGKLPELTRADKVFKQFMDDFYNRNAPLKGVLDVKEGMTGRTVRRLLTPANVNRAEESLRRWGLNDQADALRNIADMPDRAKAVKEMEELLTSPRGFKEAKLSAAKAEDVERVETSRKALSEARSKSLKTGAGLLGVGGALETIRRLSEQPSPTRR